MLGFSTNLPGQPRMLDVLREGLREATHLDLSIAFVRFSGLQLLVQDFSDFAARGGTARVLTSTYLGVTQPEALRALANLDSVSVRLHYAQAKGAQGFHPKFALIDSARGREAWVGSSNMTKGGLTTNVEANLRQREPAIVDEVSATFDALWESEHVHDLSSPLTDAYANALLRQMEARRTRETFSFDLATGADTPEPNRAQREAMTALSRLRAHGEKRAVVIAAPGVGKTFLAAFDAQQAKAESVLFVSHRLEHLTQAKATFERAFGDERSTGLMCGDRREPFADFVFATVQSARNSETITNRKFDYVVVDEFHHAAAGSYRALLDALDPGFLLGLTATPERQDGHDVIALCDYNVAYEARLIEAINRDWLVPFHYFGIADDTVDYTESFWRSTKLDLARAETAFMLGERVDHILSHAQLHGYDGERRATVGFCAGRRHAHFMAESLRDRGLAAVAVTGDDNLETRNAVYRDFENPEHPLEWLFVADLLNEGVDIPNINSLLFLRPTESATIFIQQLGRGLRLSDHCEVLTVLDFVGHHRNAWLSLEAIADRDAPPGPTTDQDLEFTPPKNCEVVLDRKTVEILRKVKKFTRRKADWCRDTYRELRRELERPPFPVDLVARNDVPELGDFRSAFGSWLDLRVEMDDALDWERALDENSPAYQLLAAVEKDWQQQRVYAYALIWALCHSPTDPDAGYETFFARFPRWRDEHAPIAETKVWQTLEKKLPSLLDAQHLIPDVLTAIPADELLPQVEGRLRYTLEKDFRLRHGGVLRQPSALDLHRGYARPSIINHFGEQYDPTRHNKGVLTFENHPSEIVIICKLNNNNAKSEYQYTNSLVDRRTFRWQSQNQQHPESGSGQAIVEHERLGRRIRLFVQRGSHKNAIYLGDVRVVAVEGSKPMSVTFELQRSVPELVMASLAT